MERAYYDDIAGQLHGLLIRLEGRLPGKDISLVADFIDAGEFVLALEQMADVMGEDEQPLSPEERADMLALAERMQISDRVPVPFTSAPKDERRTTSHRQLGQRLQRPARGG